MNSNLVQVNWDAQKKVLFNTLGSFRNEGIHTDITLSCEGESFSAHRLILSMCSGYFKKSLANSNPSSQLLVMICGIRKPILEAILNFIYNGTATIKNEDITDFLQGGMILEIPGLKDMGTNLITNTSNNDGSSRKRTISNSSLLPNQKRIAEMCTPPNGMKDHLVENETDENMSDNESSNNHVSQNGTMNDTMEYNLINRKNKLVNRKPRGRPKIRETLKQLQAENNYDHDGSWGADNSDTGEENSVYKPSKPIQRTFYKPKGRRVGRPKKLQGRVRYSNKRFTRNLQCKLCSRSFSKIESYKEHQKLHNIQAATLFPCSNCQKEFSSERVYLNHLNKCLKGSSLKEIKKTFALGTSPNKTSSSPLNMNELQDQPEKASSSPLNKNGLQDQENEELLNNTSNEMPSVINKSDDFTNTSDIDLQKSIATLDNKHCSFCNITFKTVFKYKKHRKSNCKVLQCPYCLLQFDCKEADNYEQHVDQHEWQDHPYSCPKCSFTAEVKIHLENHISTHTGIYRFWCPLCSFQTMKWSILKTHFIQIHPDFDSSDFNKKIKNKTL